MRRERGSSAPKLRSKLHGKKSRLLNIELMKTTVGNELDFAHGDLSVSDRILMAQSFHKIYNFFSGSNGCLDVIEIVLGLLVRELAKQQIERSGDLPTAGWIDSVSTALGASVTAVARPAHLRVVLTKG